MILDGKRILVTGAVNRHSIAYSIAERAQREGAEILLTSFGRIRRMTERAASSLDPAPDVLELDINRDDDLVALTEEIGRRWGRLDGAVHAIANAPPDALGGNFLGAPRDLGPRGVRVNLISAGPISTPAASGIPGFSDLAGMWSEGAPLGWDTRDATAVADAAIFLLSDLSRAISGEIVHADGGLHCVGAAGHRVGTWRSDSTTSSSAPDPQAAHSPTD